MDYNEISRRLDLDLESLRRERKLLDKASHYNLAGFAAIAVMWIAIFIDLTPLWIAAAVVWVLTLIVWVYYERKASTERQRRRSGEIYEGA